MDHLRKMHERRPDSPPTPRTYENSAGADELIFLPASTWDYVDWLEARGDIDFQTWVLHCEANPTAEMTLSHLLFYWLWLDQCRRHRYGLHTPTNVKPEGYEEYGESANDPGLPPAAA
ncbi:hypothetical protein [Roseivivax sp. THAF30]|uniref:hypothetical protein n=1 Tax=Roseivivax sp. THAF30 TaxID=2587852 RepID=UPI0012697717|nr:hypothetical protein [Roseivivax sp. THAF30]QFT63783.1 hypothetical protein FIU91_12660 [Roseivivax sp. THAF30]